MQVSPAHEKYYLGEDLSCEDGTLAERLKPEQIRVEACEDYEGNDKYAQDDDGREQYSPTPSLTSRSWS